MAGWPTAAFQDQTTPRQCLRRESALAGLRTGGHGHGSKLNHLGTAGFDPCFHLPGSHLGYLFLTSHISWLLRLEPNDPGPDRVTCDPGDRVIAMVRDGSHIFASASRVIHDFGTKSDIMKTERRGE